MRILSEKMLRFLGLCVVAGVLVAGVLFPVVGGLGVMSNQASATVDSLAADVVTKPPPMITKVLDKNGKVIAHLYHQYRIPVTKKQINPAMKWALLSTEDKRFYQHSGVDWKGTMRAALSNGSGGSTQGGSTLTQQYVKNYLINVVNWDDTKTADLIGRQQAQEATIARKAKEARIAIQIEQKMSKADILTGYLNVVEFSRKIYGVGAAAKYYFGVKPQNLKVHQAAMLAGMVNNPQVLDPWHNPEGALKRRNAVIDRMVQNRKLAPKDARKFKKKGLDVLPKPPTKPASNCVGAGSDNGFFCAYVIDYLKEHGIPVDQVMNGGYTIRTTLDPKANKKAAATLASHVPQNHGGRTNDKGEWVPNPEVGALSVVKPGKKSHDVVALATNHPYGPDVDKGQFSYSLPSGVFDTAGGGSTFKIFTASTALEKGKAGIYTSVPCPSTYTSTKYRNGAAPYTVHNVGDGECGSPYPTLQIALATSPNTTFLYLEDQLKMHDVVDMANRLGLRNTLKMNDAGQPPNPHTKQGNLAHPQSEIYGGIKKNDLGSPAFTLGVSAFSPLEMANVDATLASGGWYCPPTPIKSITDYKGHKVKLKHTGCEHVVPTGLANTMLVGMSKDDSSGTLKSQAASAGWNRPLYSKTGTTQLQNGGAVVGGTPQFAVSSTVFQTNLPNLSFGNKAWGSSLAGPQFFDILQYLHKGKPTKQLPPADPKYMNARH